MSTEVAIGRAVSGGLRMTPPAAPVNLYNALIKAAAAAQAVHHDASNEEQGYRYASSEAIFETARKALSDHGLWLIPNGYQIVEPEQRVERLVGHLGRSLLLVHESGEAISLVAPLWPILLRDGQPRDKALGVALTSSLRYLVRDLLMIPAIGDDEANSHSDRGFKAAGRPTPRDRRSHPAAHEDAVRMPELKRITDELWSGVPAPGSPFAEGVGCELDRIVKRGWAAEAELAGIRRRIEAERAKRKQLDAGEGESFPADDPKAPEPATERRGA